MNGKKARRIRKECHVNHVRHAVARPVHEPNKLRGFFSSYSRIRGRSR